MDTGFNGLNVFPERKPYSPYVPFRGLDTSQRLATRREINQTSRDDAWLVSMYAPSIMREAEGVMDTYQEGLSFFGQPTVSGYFDLWRGALASNPVFGGFLSSQIPTIEEKSAKQLEAEALEIYQNFNYALLQPEYPTYASALWYREPDYGHVEDPSASRAGRKAQKWGRISK